MSLSPVISETRFQGILPRSCSIFSYLAAKTQMDDILLVDKSGLEPLCKSP